MRLKSSFEKTNMLLAFGGKRRISLWSFLTAILLFGCFFQLSAKVYGQGITLSKRNADLSDVFLSIYQQSGYYFLYKDELLKGAKRIDIEVKRATIEEVLKIIFRDQPLTYSISDHVIVVRQKVVIQLGIIDISGKVTDGMGEPLEGATITIKGSAKGTFSDEFGSFELKQISSESILIISFTGYISKEVRIAGSKFISVSLTLNLNALDETVIKGYYNTTRRLNTGNVSKVGNESIQSQPVSDPILTLEGRVPGLYIQSGSGVPGSSSKILLRGLNSIANSNNPLYVVDGIPFISNTLTSAYLGGGAASQLSPFNNLNPSDIERIEVLKDADATAIYGSRGSNGVILITTKKGKSGKTNLEINAYTGIEKVAHRLSLLNTQQYLQMRHEAFQNDGILNLPGNAYDVNGTWDTTRYTDWQNTLVGGTARISSIQGSVSGGNQNTQFLISGNYSNQTTVFPGDFSDIKGTVHINLNHFSTNKKFKFSLSSSYTSDNSKLPTTDLTSYTALPPDAPALYDSVGKLNWQKDTWTNPFGMLAQKAKAVTSNLIGGFNLSYEILAGLQIKANVGYNQLQMDQSIQIPLFSYTPSYSSYTFLRSNNFATSRSKTWVFEPQINYSRKISAGQFQFIIGTTFQETNQNAISQLASDFQSDALIGNLAAAAYQQIASISSTDYKYNALYGRLYYNWKDKYLLNVTGRRDGSSRFGPDRQFGNFGAVGVGWIFSKEDFIHRNASFLSYGKIRGSYGNTGNDQLQDYQYLSGYSSYPLTYLGISGLYPSRIPNPYYGWEIVKKMEAGLELGFIADRLLLNISYYKNRTGNQLVGYSLPTITGFSSVKGNLPAIVENNGLELELNTINIKSDNFSWNTHFNISVPKNKLISYPNLSASSYADTYVEGKSLYIQKLYHEIGVDQKTGVYAFEDINRDGNITYPDDLQAIKETAQQYFGGFENVFGLKNWQLDIFFQFVKQTAYNYLTNFPNPGFTDDTNGNQPTSVLSRWRTTGDNSPIQRFTASNSDAANAYSNVISSDYAISDASFIRLKNLELSYQIPRPWKDRIHLQGGKLYLQGQNLFTITKYVGLDPEVRALVLPPLRIMAVGIQLIF